MRALRRLFCIVLYSVCLTPAVLRAQTAVAQAAVAQVVVAQALVAQAVVAQPAVAQAPGAQAAGEADPGVRPFRLIDRDEIRVSRVELQPGAVRRVHVHDDVEYHVWTPVSGTLEITIGNDAAKVATPGQAFFMKKGTPHGFRNTGTTPAAVFEIFVKRSTTTAALEPLEFDSLIQLALATLATPDAR
jgi:quercetin dioxygenase-like cupin family protein